MPATLIHATAFIVADAGSAALNSVITISAAAVILVVWRASSAAYRHTIWLAAFIACAASVLASPWAPRISLRVKAPAMVAATRTVDLEHSSMRVTPGSNAETSIDDLQAGVASRVVRVPTPKASRLTSVSWTTVIAVVWLAGVIAVFVRVIAGAMSLHRAAKRFRRITDSTWTAALCDAEWKLATNRSITLVWGEHHSTPATFGVRRPVIIVPAEANDWTDEQREVVLLHEVAHIVRGDVAAQMLANIACAVLWFQPLIWIARWRLRAEAEGAADDCVLSAAIPASAYAARLLEFARACGSHVRAPTPAVGMFTDSHLERRFAAMFETTRSRASTSRGMRRVAAVFALVGGTGAPGMRFAAPVAAPRLPNRAVTIATTVRPRTVLPSVGAPSDKHIAFTGSDVTVRPAVGDTSNLVGAMTPTPASVSLAAVPDLSGTWIADTMYVPPIGHRVAAGPVITIAQNDSTIWIARREISPFEMMGVPSADAWVDPYRMRHPQASALIHLDGTRGDEVVSYSGHMVVTNRISGVWDGRTLVTTSTQRVPDQGGWEWARIDRWSLTSDSTLIRAITIVTPPHGAQVDTVWASSTAHLLRAR